VVCTLFEVIVCGPPGMLCGMHFVCSDSILSARYVVWYAPCLE